MSHSHVCTSCGRRKRCRNGAEREYEMSQRTERTMFRKGWREGNRGGVGLAGLTESEQTWATAPYLTFCILMVVGKTSIRSVAIAKATS